MKILTNTKNNYFALCRNNSVFDENCTLRLKAHCRYEEQRMKIGTRSRLVLKTTLL